MPFTPRPPQHLKITENVDFARSGWGSDRRVPMIRMRGEWLAENGFIAGEHVVVTVEQGRITLTLTSEA